MVRDSDRDRDRANPNPNLNPIPNPNPNSKPNPNSNPNPNQVLGFDEYTVDQQTYLTVTDENTDDPNPGAPSDLWVHSTPAYCPAS